MVQMVNKLKNMEFCLQFIYLLAMHFPELPKVGYNSFITKLQKFIHVFHSTFEAGSCVWKSLKKFIFCFSLPKKSFKGLFFTFMSFIVQCNEQVTFVYDLIQGKMHQCQLCFVIVFISLSKGWPNMHRCKLCSIIVQLLTDAIVWLLNGPYGNEVVVRGQNIPSKYC